MNPSPDVVKALAVCVELIGAELSKPALKVMATDLAQFPERWVLGALTRCRKELRGRLTLADILDRMDDGRPGPEEAWAMCPKGENVTVIWTPEIAAAWGVATALDNPVQARMAFVERYKTLIRAARESGIPPKWLPSLGADPKGREAAVLEAVERGRISADYGLSLLPFSASPDVVTRLLSTRPALLEA